MSEHDMTDSPQTTGGSLVGWAIGLLILLVGMVVAGFTLDAGQVWVVPETQSYTLLEKVEPVDLWVPQDSSKAKWLEFQGVPLMQTVLRTLDEHSLAVPGVDKSIAPSTRGDGESLRGCRRPRRLARGRLTEVRGGR